MKILAVGDVHIKLDNIQEFEIFEEKLIEKIKDKEPDICILLGDICHYHDKLFTPCLNRAQYFIDKIRKLVPTYVLVGNHDYSDNSQYLTDSHWMNMMKEWDGVRIIDKPFILKKGDIKIILCPYVFPGRFVEALDSLIEEKPSASNKEPSASAFVPKGTSEWRDANVIFAHQEFYGCKMGAIVSADGDRWGEELPLVVSGHIHDSQWIGKNVYYSGSSFQHAFGESYHKTIPFITLSPKGGKRNIEELELDLPKKKIINKNIENVEEFEVEDDSEDKLRLNMNCSHEEFKTFKKTDKYQELLDKGVKVCFKPKEVKGSGGYRENKDDDFSKLLDRIVLDKKNPLLFSLYYQIVHDKEVSEDDVLFLD